MDADLLPLQRELELFGQRSAPCVAIPKRWRTLMLRLLLMTLLLAIPCSSGPSGWITLPGHRALIVKPHSIVMVTMTNGGFTAVYARTLAEAEAFAKAPVTTPVGRIVGYSHVTSTLLDGGGLYVLRQGPIVGNGSSPTTPAFVTTWTDASGATHTVSTPGGRTDSARRHLRNVRIIQEAFPPIVLPAVQPTPLPADPR